MFTGLLECHYLDEIVDYKIVNKLTYASTIISFYVPNILQTLLITLFWPINFYFVKACVFILILPLTRNVSYFSDIKETQISIEGMQEKITKIDELQTKIDKIQQETMNENKNING
uniref:Uncharacterized protein n=1 Tax=Rhizophagus irregularis (strain DAOM 181602 / DAOM 197198 / MUCL 43194) TaxID=747089 RepID=U9TC84_RHIID